MGLHPIQNQHFSDPEECNTVIPELSKGSTTLVLELSDKSVAWTTVCINLELQEVPGDEDSGRIHPGIAHESGRPGASVFVSSLPNDGCWEDSLTGNLLTKITLQCK